MKKFAAFLTLVGVLSLGAGLASLGAPGDAAVRFPLEWNARRAVDIPYEVEISPAKLEKLVGAPKGCGWQVSAMTPAGERALATDVFAGKAPGTLRLRFRVPSGTTALACRSTERAGIVATDALDNLFAGALDRENAGRWNAPAQVTVTPLADGVNFKCAKGHPYVTYTVDVPEGLAGKAVIQEFDLTSRTRLAWGSLLHIAQLDGEGKVLPEYVADPRWTSHMRPTDKFTRYRDEGHIHPRAKRLRVELELRCESSAHDAYGLPVADNATIRPDVDLTHLAVRPAEELPFPKWNDDFFTDGVSGAAGDAALTLGGEDERGFFYQLVSRGGWTCRHEFRREDERHFPSGDGTVEAWFNPDWTSLKPGDGAKGFYLFQAYQGWRENELRNGQGEMFALTYVPTKGVFRLAMKDFKGHAFAGESKKVEFPSGAWSHLAVAWACGDVADVYVNGRKILSVAIPGYLPVPIGDETFKIVNDLWAMEFYVGSPYKVQRGASGFGSCADLPPLTGAVDELRVSTGRRYGADFAPAKDFAVDAATRALFKFDRAFDGVSGGGFGFIPASVHAKRDRVEHRFAGGYYWARDLLPENDPGKIFNIRNFPALPSVADFRASRVLRTKTARVKDGDAFSFTASERAYPEYVEYSNRNGKEPVAYPILVAKGRPDPRSFGDLADTIAVGGATDREKANRVFQYVLGASDYFMNYQVSFPRLSDRPECARTQAMVMLNSYCGFECGSLNNLAANLLAAVAGCPASQTSGYGHSFEQVFYDGKNHIYDLSARKFFPAMDNETAAYLKEGGDQPGLFNRADDDADSYIRKGSRGHWVQTPSYQEKFGVVLNPGETYRVHYANDGQSNNLQIFGHGRMVYDQTDYSAACGAKGNGTPVLREDRIFPHYSTSVLAFDGVPAAENPAFANVTASSFCYRVRSPHPIVWAEYAARLKDGRMAALDVSTDGGKTFGELPRTADGVAALEYRVKARHAYLVRVRAPMAEVARFTARTEGMVNTRTYPAWAKGGENAFTYRAVKSPPVDVTVAWREPAKEIVVKGAACSGAIPGFERGLFLLDPKGRLSLDVTGASAQATVRTYGKIRAALTDGRLTVAADPAAKPAVKRGVDSPERANPETYFAWADIVDGDAVKRLTFLVAPDARLVTADAAKVFGREAAFKAADGTSAQDRLVLSGNDSRVRFPYGKLPAGQYAVFALVRFSADAMADFTHATYERWGNTQIVLHGPADAKARSAVASPINGGLEFYKAMFGVPGGPSRWKWDASMAKSNDLHPSYASWFYRLHDFPQTDGLDFSLASRKGFGAELAAILVIRDPDREFRLDLHRFLSGLNADPASVGD